MGFLRWPLIFSMVYGLLWVRARIWQDHPSRHEISDPLQSIQSEDPTSPASLSYAFDKIQTSEREPAEAPLGFRPPANEFEVALGKIQGLRNDPKLLLITVRDQLSRLDPEHVVERSILLREAYVAFDHDLSPQMSQLLVEERVWLGENSLNIRDSATLNGYVQEITKFTVQNAPNSKIKLQILKQMAHQLATDPRALRAFRGGVLDHAEWDLPEIIEDAPPSIQIYLQGS